MFSLDVFAILGVALVIMLLAVLFLLPSEKSARRSFYKKPKPLGSEDTKDWKAACLKLEKHIHTLRAEIEQGKTREKNSERDLLIQREKAKKLQEKISQERGWQEKEITEKERKGQEVIRLKEFLTHAEEELQKEHGERLRLERELREGKEALASAGEAKRVVESQMAKLQAQFDAAGKQIKELREQNAKLSKDHDEATWVSKSEYVKLEQQLHAVQKEFERFRINVKRENF